VLMDGVRAYTRVTNAVVIDALHGNVDFIPLNYLLQSDSVDHTMFAFSISERFLLL